MIHSTVGLMNKSLDGREIAVLHASGLKAGGDRIVGKGFRFDVNTAHAFPSANVFLQCGLAVRNSLQFGVALALLKSSREEA